MTPASDAWALGCVIFQVSSENLWYCCILMLAVFFFKKKLLFSGWLGSVL